MTVFDRLCAVLAFILGCILILLGGFGVFLGCKANFFLPPILGIAPLFVGIGIVRPIIIAWRVPAKNKGQWQPELQCPKCGNGIFGQEPGRFTCENCMAGFEVF
jgi:hypothetical protein